MDSEHKAAVDKFLGLARDRFDIQSALVFGSTAMGLRKAVSDIDVALLLEHSGVSKAHLTLELADIAYDVLLDTGLRIDPVPIWTDEWTSNNMPNSLIDHIKQQGVVQRTEMNTWKRH
jgi:predicted nucleotidyltransferase